ncbi:rhythmically expressed gene 5 protein [Cylas formicarius]|uniref:rhythmically expressed gene 5 protein n=1 Tax=Cylas formicarius TaxID=197179 RepID=UPI002958BD75|nr:rhythmically expressed gene 5 protein [Cylas formicarius]
MVGLAGVLCFCAMFGGLRGSAIPMWEFLSKQEKTSYIYSLFAHQVENHCEGSNVPECGRRLLKYGLGTLKNMPEERLDAMDPYQRGANNIIWEALMEGHPLMKTTPRPASSSSSTTAKPNSYEDQLFGGDYDDFGSESAASVKFDNVYVVPPPKDFIVPKTEPGSEKNNEEQSVFTRFQNDFRPIAVTTEKVVGAEEAAVLLTGPMLVKVFPDGTPVRESTVLPQDEDLRQYRLSKVKVPRL